MIMLIESKTISISTMTLGVTFRFYVTQQIHVGLNYIFCEICKINFLIECNSSPCAHLHGPVTESECCHLSSNSNLAVLTTS